MKIHYKETFKKQYQKLPTLLQRRINEKLDLLISNPQHPSLQIKKMEGFEGIWEGRISRGYRFTFEIKGDTYILRKIGKHEILKRP